MSDDARSVTEQLLDMRQDAIMLRNKVDVALAQVATVRGRLAALLAIPHERPDAWEAGPASALEPYLRAILDQLGGES